MIHQTDIERVTGNRRYPVDADAEKRAYNRLWWMVAGFSLTFIGAASLIWGRR